MNEQEIAKMEKEWGRQRPLLERKQKIIDEKKTLKKKNKKSMTKILITLLFINFTIIELFVIWTTIQSINLASITGSIDYSPLVALIGTVLGETLSFGIYCLKSSKENSSGGLTFELAMKEKDDESLM